MSTVKEKAKDPLVRMARRRKAQRREAMKQMSLDFEDRLEHNRALMTLYYEHQALLRKLRSKSAG
jgi:hypothetical protein